jgi:hypothetical protein
MYRQRHISEKGLLKETKVNIRNCWSQQYNQRNKDALNLTKMKRAERQK